MLKDEGRVVINWSPKINTKQGFFWAELIPEACDKWYPRTPSMDKMKEILESAGFVKVHMEALLDEIIFDPELYTPWKLMEDIDTFSRSDSVFTLCTQAELDQAVATVRKMHEQGSLEKWWARKEAERKAIGQTIHVYCEKQQKV